MKDKDDTMMEGPHLCSARRVVDRLAMFLAKKKEFLSRDKEAE